jgi:hypothetical protein
MELAAAYEPVVEEVRELLPSEAVVVDAHTHLGVDEDGQSLTPAELISFLDQVSPRTRACTFALHDPDRSPAYRVPNDRVLQWADESGDHRAASIFAVAQEARVPILIHAGRGMPPMDLLADLALRYPEVALVLAHAGIADQGMFASRLAGHPKVLYDTSTFSVFDQLQLFARVPVERIVFASDVPYGRPLGALHAVLRIADFAGLDEAERTRLVGATMLDVLENRPLPAPRPPRVAEIRPMSGRLTRVNGYVLMAFAAALGGPPPPDFARSLPFLALARAACRDPDPGPAGAALERIDQLLSAAERLLGDGGQQAQTAVGLVAAAGVIAATERLPVADAEG